MTTPLTVNANLDLLDQLAYRLADPRNAGHDRARTRNRAPAHPRTATTSLWKASLEAAAPRLAERALQATLATLATGGLAWLALSATRFAAAFEGLAHWVRAAAM